ncbi:MAG: hypothetical protein CMJ46_03880 [Planctomyces sp.]|nr:hypothetical protein [Planctomyces sp.]
MNPTACPNLKNEDHRPRYRGVGVVVVFLVVLNSLFVTSQGQETDVKLTEQVAELVTRLENEDKTARREVESALIELGPRILPMLPEPARTQPMWLRVGLERVRQVLQRQKSAASLEASRFSFSGKVTVNELLTQLSQQTENELDASTVPDDVLQREVTIEFKQTSFWEVIDWIEANQPLHYAKLSKFTTRDERHAAITHLHQGPVRFEFSRPTSKQLFGNDDEQLWRVPVRVHFEPRLRPLYLHWKGNDFEAVGYPANADENPQEIKLPPFNPASSIELAAERDQGGLVTILDFTGPREVPLKSIELQGAFDLILAAGHEQVEFDLSGMPAGVTRRVGPASVELLDLKRAQVEVFDEDETRQEDVLRVTLDVVYSPQVLSAFESFRTWMFSDPIWIETAKGGRIEREPRFETLNQFPGEIKVAYHFDVSSEALSGSRLLYRIPTLVTRIELPVRPVLLPIAVEADK